MEQLRYMDVANQMNLLVLGDSPGVVYWKPAGLRLYENLRSFIRKYHQQHDYWEVKSPSIVNSSLFEQSGHMQKYRANMFLIDEYALRPMSCPNHIILYQSELRSYRDLPVKLFEFGQVYRNESSGSLQSLFRQREFCQDDSHVFVAENQINEVVKSYLKMSLDVYKKLGFMDVKFMLSLRPEQRFGSDQQWDDAENALRKSFHDMSIEFQELPQGGAFYGPKIEMQVKDKLGRYWQMGVIQLDYVLPERFDLGFINEKGLKERPVILHHAVLGSLERMIGVLLESFDKNLPDFLHPYPHVVVPVSEKYVDYAKKIFDKLKENDWVYLDSQNANLGKKLQHWKHLAAPSIYVVGQKEEQLFQEKNECYVMKNNVLIKL